MLSSYGRTRQTIRDEFDCRKQYSMIQKKKIFLDMHNEHKLNFNMIKVDDIIEAQRGRGRREVEHQMWILRFFDCVNEHQLTIENFLEKCENSQYEKAILLFVIYTPYIENQTMWFECLTSWTKFSIQTSELEASRNDRTFR